MEANSVTKFDINANVSSFYMKSVEIIIPFHGQHASVINLVESIFRTVNTNKYLITLVDDKSDLDSFSSVLEKAKWLNAGVRYLRQPQQKGFAAAVNYALKNPLNVNIPYVCVMHSDTECQSINWLENLGTGLLELKKQNVKMVSPLTNNPLVFNNFLQSDQVLSKSEKILSDSFLPMYCFLCHRELFTHVGLLSEFPYVGTECEDYALRMLQKGFKQAVICNSWVRHQGRLTIKEYDRNKKVQELLRNVKKQFYDSMQNKKMNDK